MVEVAQTAKRDYLRGLENKYQQRWQNECLFEVHPPVQSELVGLSQAEIREKYPKWFGNFPYPYLYGSLHLGHAFSISKIEFAAGYERLLGKRVLFPLAFHVTGLPIQASADKIIQEMELFGPDFQKYEEVQTELDAEVEREAEVTLVNANNRAPYSAPVGKSKAKKGKIVAKSAGFKYQFQIMDFIGVPRSEIRKFADPWHWLTYFPPLAIEDIKAFGFRIDWRRAFITTDANPFYDAFVRWQMNKLYKLGKIKFGERYTIYSPKDGQPCMDHDRQDGEGLKPLEYTCIKMEVVNWSPAANESIESKMGGRKVFMIAATLRPETMHGQTNCFVGTMIKYGVFAINDEEAFLCQLELEVRGADLIGTKIKAPFAIHPEVYILPMESVLATKGTGVVTSVPSDSPDDFQTLVDLRKKPKFYNVDLAWVSIDPVPVLCTPTYGNMTAPALVEALKILSQKDKIQLAEAKEIAYKEGFYNGTMIVGEFSGERVQDAKLKVRESMIKQGVAFAYAEPDGLVISRSGDECVVALLDQWYLDYGEPSWREQVEEMLAGMNLYSNETRNAFKKALGWLNQWACARTYGLGSKIPWDPEFLVESLSDSTIYMSYYTVSHLLQGGSVDGSKPGPLGITPDQMTDEIWEYISCNVKGRRSQARVQLLLPFDIRSSGKDLINNHLTFALYTHAAIFPKDKWPLSMRTNGHVMLNGEKLSKSKGNNLSLRQAVEKFGADATRLALADSGDGMEDANFDEKLANANVLRVHTLLSWCDDTIKNESSLRTGELNYHDKAFLHEVNELINVTQVHYAATDYKDALKYGFYELQNARDWYREVTSDVRMHADLVKYWIRVLAILVSPIAPHFAEHFYSDILQSPTSVQLARWPTPKESVDHTIIEAIAYMRSTIKSSRDAEASLLKMLSKTKPKKDGRIFDPKLPKSLRIYVATSFPGWQDGCVQIIKEAHDEQSDRVDDVKVKELLIQKGLIKNKNVMPFIQAFKKRMAQLGAQTAFRRSLSFVERVVLKEFVPYIKKSLALVDVEIFNVEEALSKTDEPGYTKIIIESSEPGNSAFEYHNQGAVTN